VESSHAPPRPRGILSRMVLKLDPRYPLVWRSPTSLQFGVSAPVVVLNEVSGADEHLISALTMGISRPGLTMVARACGADDPDVVALLDRLAPALERRREATGHTVTLAGTGLTAHRIAEALEGAGVTVHVVADPRSVRVEPCDLAIAVGHFVLAPELHGLWLRRDIPHLPVVISDTAVSIGPIVDPGVGPCLYCLRFYRTDADAAWPALSAQLWGRQSGSESALVASEVSAAASRTALARLEAGHTASVHRSTEIDVDTGATSMREWLPHPRCGCAEVSAAVRPGSGSPDADRRGTTRPTPIPSPPTSGSACA